MNELQFRKGVILGAKNLLDMMALNPTKFSKTVYASAPPVRDPSFPLRFRIRVNDYVREGAQLFIREDVFPDATITRLLMRKDKKYVTVELPTKRKDLFDNVDFHDISFRSDMRFLIERIRDFYVKTSISFDPPAPKPLPPCDITLEYPLSEAQTHAVESVLNSPVSYVWGAPGTGKTNAVLVTCLLRYLNADKRVALLAPTNNAVEQVLRGMLPILKSAGVNLRKLYRVGTASYEFAQEFPEVVGDAALQATQEELQERKKALKAEETALHEWEADVCEVERRIDTLVSAREKIAVLVSDYEAFSARLQNEKQKLVDTETTHQAAKRVLSAAAAALSEQNKLLSYYQTAIESKEKQYKANRFIPWKASLRRELKAEILKLNNSKDAALHEYPTIQDKYESAASAEKEATYSFNNQKLFYDRALDSTDTCIRSIQTALKDASVPLSGSDQPVAALQTIETQLSQEQERLSAIKAQTHRSLEQIRQEESEVNESLATLGESDKLKQMKNARVLCGTFDTMVKYLPQQEDADPYEHVFIDEAGYTSLARGMMAFSCECPVAFFGDHYQLPPVCPMGIPEIQKKHPLVVFWALSVVAFSDLLKGDGYNLYNILVSDQAFPVFDCLSYTSLLKTYRFGPQLASLLDRHIYRTGLFLGNEEKNFQVVVLHGSKASGELYKWESKNEALAIKQYVNSHPFDEDNFAVLAPYNKQVNLLKDNLPGWKENIMTVHKSQGQEWDTVILSVVDTSDMFLVKSTEKKGRSVLNTAISRTKHTLVLVCDVNYWLTQPDQMVKDLIDFANNQRNKS